MLASLAGAWFNRPVILLQGVAMPTQTNLTIGLLALWTLMAMAVTGTAVAQQPVDLELVLAIDISGSVDEEEAALQREGYVMALTNPRVVAAMGGGPLALSR
jgi:hypothetical protein